MKVKVLDKDIQSFKKHLDGKSRIMTYGAGVWANDIKKLLKEYGYELNCAIVDKQYCQVMTSVNSWGRLSEN